MFIPIDEVDFQKVVDTWNQGFSDYLLPINVDKAGLEHRIQSLKLSKKLSAVFSIDGELAGVILLGIQTFQKTKVMWIGGMAVVPKYRRSKVASKLIDYAERLANENQCEQLVLEVLAANERAKQLYEVKGFQLVNELAVGSVVLPITIKVKNDLAFKSASKKEQSLTENQWTPWQNRCIFSDRNYEIYHEESKIGSISFNLVEESSERTLILRQLHVSQREDRWLVIDILLKLKEQENIDTIKIANFDMAIPEYLELEKIGVILQLTQFQLAKKLSEE
ncbi:GNAT family N-acetyltransferase [Enterococcus quebecensis]|uniref:GNAT family N-acetyltransferase n=1 Tax=Enterococcus quebecensis TaxID=903983 RepID=A0A1E5GRK9_9ENTE|nr:GNAT family N-acetyltransferase [Enterococcus quebecensis]OEG15309.1 GNAT family N-acetyltransferase [Enterococcus quebecensis]OJG72271.1 hypothetical protein RV12_GL000977 [Enterococcus quebecensis]